MRQRRDRFDKSETARHQQFRRSAHRSSDRISVRAKIFCATIQRRLFPRELKVRNSANVSAQTHGFTLTALHRWIRQNTFLRKSGGDLQVCPRRNLLLHFQRWLSARGERRI